MKKKTILLCAIALLLVTIFLNILVNAGTESTESFSYYPPNTNDIRTPAEFEKTKGVIIRWAIQENTPTASSTAKPAVTSSGGINISGTKDPIINIPDETFLLPAVPPELLELYQANNSNSSNNLLGNTNKKSLDLNLASLAFAASSTLENVSSTSAPTDNNLKSISTVSYQSLYKWLVEQIQEAQANVYILVQKESDISIIKGILSSTKNVEFIICPTNSIWTRDYSAFNIYTDKKLGFVDGQYFGSRILDDDSPKTLAKYFSKNLFIAEKTVKENRFQIDGGNFMTDGFGTAISSVNAYSYAGYTPEYIRSTIKNYLGINNYIFTDKLPKDLLQHIDQYMKFLDEETILVGQLPSGDIGYNNILNREQIEANVKYIQNNYKSIYNRPYKIVRIPIPVTSNNTSFETYTNSLIVNDRVLVPIYNLPTDEEALQIYRNAMPGYKIVGQYCGDIIKLYGAIHCITHEIPQEYLTQIKHAKFEESYPQGVEIPFSTELWSTENINSVTLYLKQFGEQNFKSYTMTNSNGKYSTKVLAEKIGTAQYYIQVNTNNSICYKPQNADKGGYLNVEITKGTFSTTPVVTTPVITTPIVTTPRITKTKTPSVTTPVATTPIVTTPIVTTPVVTTPIVTTPIITTPVTTYPGIRGDVNKDGKVNSTDLALFARVLLGQYVISSEQFSLFDINSDKRITSTDLALLTRYVLGGDF